MSRRRIAAMIAVPLAVSAIAGCTSGATSETPSPSATANALAAHRWWSDPAHASGSTIDPRHATAGVEGLRPSRAQYCTVLRDTVRAGRSILPGVSVTDPALLATTEAFAATVEHLAPSEVSAQWRVVGGALVAFVRSQGKTLGEGVDPASLTKAAATISADAKAKCGLDLTGATDARR